MATKSSYKLRSRGPVPEPKSPPPAKAKSNKGNEINWINELIANLA